MESIENIAVDTYRKNLEFFAQKYPDIHKKILALEYTIEQNLYTQKYELEYLENYFDVKEIQSGHYLYGNNSNEITQNLQKMVTFSKDTQVFEGFPLYYNQENIKNKGDKQEGLSGIYPLMTYYIDNTTKSDKFKDINKFIFIGTGLGMQIPLVHKKVDAQSYFLIEDDLELFRLSLFCTPYYSFKDVDISFSIAQNEADFTNLINEFLDSNFLNNRYIKYLHFPSHTHKKINLIQSAIASQGFFTFPYKTRLSKFIRPLTAIKENYSFINLAQRLENPFFKNKPVLIIASGPSLVKNLAWVKKNQDKFIISAVSSSLKILHKNNIIPDIVIHLDGFDFAITLFEEFDVSTFLQNSILIAGSFTPNKILQKLKKENCFLLEEDGTYYHSDFNSNIGPCVGSTSIYQMLRLNAQDIYLLGTDFAVDSKTGRTHSEGHVSTEKLNLNSAEEINHHTSIRGTIIPVEGNFVEKVYTTSLFHVSLQDLHNKIPVLKNESQKIYNLNDGASINLAIPMHIQDLDISAFPSLDKQQEYINFLKLLHDNSISHLSESDILSLKKRLNQAKQIKNIIFDYKNKMNFTKTDTFLSHLLKLVDTIYLQSDGRESNNLVSIYDSYFQYTLPLIMDFFNREKIKNQKHHVKKINKMIVSGVEEIVNVYETSIQDFLNEEDSH